MTIFSSSFSFMLLQLLLISTFQNANGSIFSFIKSFSPSVAKSGGEQKDFRDNLVSGDKIGIILLNLGGPEKQEDVQGFLYNLFSDPDIIRLPKFPCPLAALQKPIAYFISRRRAPRSKAAYQRIGGGSPINQHTREQASEIEKELATRGVIAKCYIGMRYWSPYTVDAIHQAMDDGVTTFIILPLYPHYSISTTGSSLKEIKTLMDRKKISLNHTVIPYWFDRPGYIQAMSQLIVHKYNQFSSEEMKEGVHILFSAHGVPVSYVEAGDPYKSHIEQCAMLISQSVEKIINQPNPTSTFIFPGHNSTNHSSLNSTLNPVICELSFQSRVGPIQWLKPYTDERIVEMGTQQVKNLLVVPISFVSEHIETLEEIDIEYQKLAHESGIRHWERAPALNSNPLFIQELADLVIHSLHSSQISVTDALQVMEPESRQKSSLFNRISRLFRRSKK